ncbi:hypothetical protein ACMFMF_001899 [Clarireedia jacksonii]
MDSTLFPSPACFISVYTSAMCHTARERHLPVDEYAETRDAAIALESSGIVAAGMALQTTWIFTINTIAPNNLISLQDSSHLISEAIGSRFAPWFKDVPTNIVSTSFPKTGALSLWYAMLKLTKKRFSVESHAS